MVTQRQTKDARATPRRSSGGNRGATIMTDAASGQVFRRKYGSIQRTRTGERESGPAAQRRNLRFLRFREILESGDECGPTLYAVHASGTAGLPAAAAASQTVADSACGTRTPAAQVRGVPVCSSPSQSASCHPTIISLSQLPSNNHLSEMMIIAQPASCHPTIISQCRFSR